MGEFQDSMNRDATTIDELVAVTLKVLEASAEPASLQQVPAIKAKPNTALKPFMLKHNDMPVTMQAWIDQCETYRRTSHLDTLPDKDQQAYFLTLLDSSLRARIKKSLTDEIPALPTRDQQDSCISIFVACCYVYMCKVMGIRKQTL